MGQSPHGRHCIEGICRSRSRPGLALVSPGLVLVHLANETTVCLGTWFVDGADMETVFSRLAHAYTMLDTDGLLLLVSTSGDD